MAGVLSNLNYIKEVSVYPCATPGPIIAITTALEAAAPVLVELASFSCIDIYKTRLGISWRCGKQLKAIIKAAHGAKVIDNVHFIYQFAAPVERILWYWFVAELTTNFLAKWTSLVYQQQGCLPALDDCTVSASEIANPLISQFFDNGIGYIIPPGSCFHRFHDTYGFEVPDGYYFDTQFSIETVPLFQGQPGGFTIWLRRNNSRGDPIFDYPAHEYDPPLIGRTTRGSYKVGGNPHTAHGNVPYQWMVRPNSDQRIVGGHMITRISRFPLISDNPIGAGCFAHDWRQSLY
jgi:hypothetical protein